MSYAIDANVLISLFHHTTSEDNKLRLEGLISSARKTRRRLIVPTPGLTEFAVRAKQEELDFIMGQTVFHIAPFDTKAALICADMLRDWSALHKSVEHKRKAKFDIQIIAISRAYSASTIVSSDSQLRTQAKRAGIGAIDIPELDIPDYARQKNLPLPTD